MIEYLADIVEDADKRKQIAEIVKNLHVIIVVILDRFTTKSLKKAPASIKRKRLKT